MDPQTLNVLGPQQLVGSGMNKQPHDPKDAENTGESIDELDITLSDEELIALKDQWETRYLSYEAKIKARQEKQKNYYLGKQENMLSDFVGEPISSNLLFEAEETFLPAALSKNPEPVVYTDNTKEGNDLADNIKTMLQYHADVLVLRRKLTVMTRHWSIYFLGALKHGWDTEMNDITTDVVDPQNFVLDPEACIDAYGDYDGDYLGERKTCSAKRLIELFPKHRAYILIKVNGKLGTPITYTEWWNDDYCFYTFQDIVLDKHKNPHYNYPKKVQALDIVGEPIVSEEGEPQMDDEEGSNHFSRPKKPYTFLSVFSLGEQPHDITGLIEQNIPNQNRITRRTNQIDYNLSKANNSDVFSEKNFTQETAKQAANALAKGTPVLVPNGVAISEAIVRLQAPGLDASHFNALAADKQDLRSIFGTEGISSQQQNEETTARGMILNQQFDNSRIGGGIGDALEQVADNVFNWWVQLYYVYYDEPHFAAIMGQMKAVEYITLSRQDMDRRIVVSVSPDSMKPHDEITQMNQAMSLWEAGAIDPKTLLTMLNVPDPQTTAESTVLWLVDQNAYLQLNFPELAGKLAMMQQQAAMAGMPPAGGAPGDVAGLVPGEPDDGLEEDPASAALSNVPLTG